LEKKISFAKKLLVDTSLSVKQISDKLCFSDEYYFSNIFKKKTGQTPSQYRSLQGSPVTD
jgi:YesN/AraC family two-component response regulator